MSIKTLLGEEIQSEFEELKKIQVGTDEHKAAVDSVTKLVDRAIDLERVEIERVDKAENRDIEYSLKTKELDDERKDRWVKNGLTAVSVVGGFALTVWGTIKSIEFEKDGTITTIMGRGFIQKLLPKK